MPGIRTKKILTFAAISLLGLSLGAVISFYVVLRLSAPVTDGELRLPGINHQVEITFDSMGICQIWAETENDAWFALGYQHAADRMFQMDLSRRLAGGRLSEILGDITRDIDIDQRRVGHHRMAQRALESLSEINRARLQGYANGVNAYKNSCRALPFEYRFLPIEFEDWTVLDCLTLLSFQTWFSNALMDRDQFYNSLAEKVGRQKAQSLVVPYPDWAPAAVLESDQLGLLPRREFPRYGPAFGATDSDDRGQTETNTPYKPFQKAIAASLFDYLRVPMQMTHSSNGWVVAPQKSASGAAMLASDPHLELTRLPQFWYAAGVHIKQDSVDVLGISTPGLPLFVMGHNGLAAWAFTAGGVDVTDYYLEKINPDDTNQYLRADGWHDFDIIHDSVFISDLDSFIHVTFRESLSGPTVAGSENESQIYSIHWAGTDIDLNSSLNGGFDLHRVTTFEQFRNAVTNMGVLDANMLYADANGNIGYQLATPIKAPDTVSPFALGNAEYYGRMTFFPPDETPHSFNPDCGWIASCNNLPQRSPYVQGHYFANRIVSIAHLLENSGQLTSDDLRTFQMDRNDRYYLRFKDEFARVLSALDENDWAKRIRNWNGSMDTSSQEAALVETYLSLLDELTFEDELGQLYHRTPAKWIEVLPQIDQAGWFDDVTTPEVLETYDDISANAMEDALTAVNGTSWGDIHTLRMAHPLSQIPILGSLLNLSSGPTPWGGSAGTLFASFNRATQDGHFESMAGPSWRFVIDFANVDGATMVLPAGNSGNPMSDHFFDFHEMWKTGQQWTVPISYEKVKARAVSTLVLSPVESPDY